MVGSVCSVQCCTSVSRNCHLGCKRFADAEEIETEVRKWLRQQLEDAGFDAMVKRLDMCINVCGGYVEKQMFF
jgi:hypothetical protein